MTSESVLLIGRETRNARDVYDAHATRLDRRADVDAVSVATYESEPIRELRDTLADAAGDVVYAVPMCTAHTHETLDEIPAALSYVPGDVRYCEPLGGNPAVTEALADRAAERATESGEVSLVLVGFGSSSKPYHRQTADYHAARLRERSPYGEVLTCYLLQNPAVECVRYNATGEEVVAVPLFLTRTEATERRIPDELELGRGGVEYADPLGRHPRVTDALHAEIGKQRALAAGEESEGTFEATLTRTTRPIATDGEGPQ